jgi:hypothetical protein
MFQVHDLLLGPVEVISQIGYLLVQAVEGVAYDSPRVAKSTSNSVLHSGQVTLMLLVPCSLICR